MEASWTSGRGHSHGHGGREQPQRGRQAIQYSVECREVCALLPPSMAHNAIRHRLRNTEKRMLVLDGRIRVDELSKRLQAGRSGRNERRKNLAGSNKSPSILLARLEPKAGAKNHRSQHVRSRKPCSSGHLILCRRISDKLPPIS